MSKETRGVGQPVKKTEETTEIVTYYTITGKEDLLDDNGYPVQLEENEHTLAKECGVRRQIKVDDSGRFINPNGLYPQKRTLDRWLTVTKSVFKNYKDFLRTKRSLYFVKAEREAV